MELATSAVRRDTPGFLMRTFHTYGDVAYYRLGPIRSHLISDPDGVKHVLQEHVKNYTKDHISYGMVRWVTGNGLLTSQGDVGLRQRRLAQPAFHRQRLVALGDLMVARTEFRRCCRPAPIAWRAVVPTPTPAICCRCLCWPRMKRPASG
jgi:cytochrome P450